MTSQRNGSQRIRMPQDKGCNIAHYIPYPKNRFELRGPKSSQSESEIETETVDWPTAIWQLNLLKGENSFTTPRGKQTSDKDDN